MGWQPVIDYDSDISRLTREKRHTLLLQLESETDRLFEEGRASQEETWDMYFGLLHECDESKFLKDRPRILSKIDTKQYNPFLSKDPGIVTLAWMRATAMGLTGKN